MQAYGSGGSILPAIESHLINLSTVDLEELSGNITRIFTQAKKVKVKTKNDADGPLSTKTIIRITAAIYLACGIGGFLFYRNKHRSQEIHASQGSESYLESEILKWSDDLNSAWMVQNSGGLVSDVDEEISCGLFSIAEEGNSGDLVSDAYEETSDGLLSAVEKKNDDGLNPGGYLKKGDRLLSVVEQENDDVLISDVHEENDDGLVSGDDDDASVPTVAVEDGRPVLADHGY